MNITGQKGPNEGKTFLAIYELKGDELRVCYDLTGKSRPAEFASKADTLLFLPLRKSRPTRPPVRGGRKTSPITPIRIF